MKILNEYRIKQLVGQGYQPLTLEKISSTLETTSLSPAQIDSIRDARHLSNIARQNGLGKSYLEILIAAMSTPDEVVDVRTVGNTVLYKKVKK